MSRRGIAILVAVVLALGAAGGLSVGLGGCDPEPGYANGTLELAVNGYAHFICSCVFVSGRDDQTCRAYARVKQLPEFLASSRIDHHARTVRVRGVFFWTASARWIDARSGCRLD